MRIMFHSNAPMVPSGYGTQVRLVGQEMVRAGHQVGVSAFAGLAGQPIEWNGMTVMPVGQINFGVDTIVPHAQHYGADLTIALMDFWQLSPIAEQLRDINLAALVPVDCEPMSYMDKGTLHKSGAQPLAMSRFAQRQMTAAGFREPPYLPHAVDTEVFRPLPLEDRLRYRQALQLQDRFVIGIVAANNDHLRKGFQEQFEAFRRFHLRHPEAFLLVHTIARSGRGLNLELLAHQMGLDPDSYRFSDPYIQMAGIFDDRMMCDLYNIMDVLSECSYAEAFGVPMLEAQACGTPVVSTRGSAMDEMRGNGWGVAAQPFWNYAHGAWWQRPEVGAIVRAYEKAHQWAGAHRSKSRDFAMGFDIREVYAKYWAPYLESKADDLAAHAQLAREAGGV